MALQKKAIRSVTLTPDAMAEYVAGLSYDVLNVTEAAEWGVPHRRQGSQLRFSKQQLLEWVQGRETYSSPKLVREVA